MFSSVSGLLSDSISEDCAKSIPLDIVDVRKKAVMKSKHSATEDAINTMSKKEELIKSSKNQKSSSKDNESSKSPAKKQDKPHKGNPAYQ